MFCDLVGSTGISAKLDAEEWRDLVGAYLDVASVAVTEMGGHVAKKLGDGLLALFGYPVAQENDAWPEVHRVAGEIALKSLAPDAEKAEKHFERALSVACQQQQKSHELRAATSLARLWRSQGKPQQARELLAPVYGWFTEGFDTLDLKEAKALLDELA